MADVETRMHLAVSPRARVLFGVVIASIVVLIGVDSTIPTIRAIRGGPAIWSDFAVDYVSAREWRQGGDPFGLSQDLAERQLGTPVVLRTEQRNPHTPFQILLLSPLAFLTFTSARVVLALVSSLALVVAIGLMLRSSGRAPWLAFFALALPFVQYELRYGQTMCLLVLVLVLASIDLRAGRDTRAGCLLGAAAAMKLFPLLLVPFLVAKGHRRIALWMAVSAATLTGAAMMAFGWHSSVEWLRFSLRGNLSIWGAEAGNLSLTGYLARTFGWSIAIPFIAAILVMGIISLRKSLWACAALSVLGSPVAWLHYGVIALPRALEVHPIVAGAALFAMSIPNVSRLPLLWVGPLWTAGILALALAPTDVSGPGRSVEPSVPSAV